MDIGLIHMRAKIYERNIVWVDKEFLKVKIEKWVGNKLLKFPKWLLNIFPFDSRRLHKKASNRFLLKSNWFLPFLLLSIESWQKEQFHKIFRDCISNSNKKISMSILNLKFHFYLNFIPQIYFLCFLIPYVNCHRIDELLVSCLEQIFSQSMIKSFSFISDPLTQHWLLKLLVHGGKSILLCNL